MRQTIALFCVENIGMCFVEQKMISFKQPMLITSQPAIKLFYLYTKQLKFYNDYGKLTMWTTNFNK